MSYSDHAQPLTDDAKSWVIAQLALGHTKGALYKSMRDAGWQRESAAIALDLSANELANLAEFTEQPTLNEQAGQEGRATTSVNEAMANELPPAVSVPLVAVDAAGTMVNAGDKWINLNRQNVAPDVWVFSNFLSTEECAELIQAAQARLSRSLTVDTQTGGESLNKARTSDGMFFTRGENAIVKMIESRIARVLNWPLQNGEGLQVLRYGPGAEYKPHYDYFDPREPGTPVILERGGQRVATLIMYLHEPEAGGATVFPDVELTVEPRRGSAVFFSYPLAHPSSLTLHGGEPVTKGEKWIATKWLREREFR